MDLRDSTVHTFKFSASHIFVHILNIAKRHCFCLTRCSCSSDNALALLSEKGTRSHGVLLAWCPSLGDMRRSSCVGTKPVSFKQEVILVVQSVEYGMFRWGWWNKKRNRHCSEMDTVTVGAWLLPSGNTSLC